MSYTVAECDPQGQRGSILELWRRNLPDAPEHRYAWLYGAGPATAWLLKSGTGSVVGAAGLMRRELQLAGRRVRAGQAIDLNVDQSHRSIGPALSLQRALVAAVKEGRFDLIYALPNAKSEPVLRRVGYRPLGTLQRWARPLASDAPFKRWLRQKGLRKATSAVVDSFLYLNSPEAFYRRPAGLRVHVTDRFDARFDGLWERAAPQFQVIGERTSAYLNWRFCQCPQVRHRVFYLASADDELLAYLVYSPGEKTAYVSDFLFNEPDKLDLLLIEFLRQMRRQKAEVVATSFLGSHVVGRRLKRLGFWMRPSDWKAMLYVDRQRLGPEAEGLGDAESWFLTRADVDTDE